MDEKKNWYDFDSSTANSIKERSATLIYLKNKDPEENAAKPTKAGIPKKKIG
jgi:hypothetical protein